jgi:1-acyl-sn-glycerol-3-phosphate acyltransferase
MDFYYKTTLLIIKIFQIISNQRCQVSGESDIFSGAKIIAGNHPNATDGLFLPFIFHEKLHFFVQGDLFDIPFVGWMLAKSKQIPVVPGQKNLALEKASELLKEDKVVAIFPEARLNPDGQAVKSGTGAIRLSLMTKAPIIPIGFYVPSMNLHHIKRMKKGRISQGHWQTHGRCYLQIGSPWQPADEINQLVDLDSLRDLTERLMTKINDLALLAKAVYEKEAGIQIVSGIPT